MKIFGRKSQRFLGPMAKIHAFLSRQVGRYHNMTSEDLKAIVDSTVSLEEQVSLDSEDRDEEAVCHLLNSIACFLR